MDRSEIEAMLRQTLEDRRLTRSERRALSEVIADLAPTGADLALLRSLAFDMARQEVTRHEDALVIGWLEDVVKVVVSAAGPSLAACHAEARFTPTDDCVGLVSSLFDRARERADVCVFTITDDRIVGSMLEAHRRGVAVRVITDDEKQFDRGSDVALLVRTGVAVRTDSSAHHMHNKFALFDRRVVLTGSYNWTRDASTGNQENLVATEDPRLVRAFGAAFERLWEAFA